MSIFDGGALRIEKSAAGSVLRYDLISRSLLACFLAPVLFLAIAQFTTVIVKLDKPPPPSSSSFLEVSGAGAPSILSIGFIAAARSQETHASGGDESDRQDAGRACARHLQEG